MWYSLLKKLFMKLFVLTKLQTVGVPFVWGTLSSPELFYDLRPLFKRLCELVENSFAGLDDMPYYLDPVPVREATQWIQEQMSIEEPTEKQCRQICKIAYKKLLGLFDLKKVEWDEYTQSLGFNLVRFEIQESLVKSFEWPEELQWIPVVVSIMNDHWHLVTAPSPPSVGSGASLNRSYVHGYWAPKGADEEIDKKKLKSFIKILGSELSKGGILPTNIDIDDFGGSAPGEGPSWQITVEVGSDWLYLNLGEDVDYGDVVVRKVE